VSLIKLIKKTIHMGDNF